MDIDRDCLELGEHSVRIHNHTGQSALIKVFMIMTTMTMVMIIVIIRSWRSGDRHEEQELSSLLGAEQ